MRCFWVEETQVYEDKMYMIRSRWAKHVIGSTKICFCPFAATSRLRFSRDFRYYQQIKGPLYKSIYAENNYVQNLLCRCVARTSAYHTYPYVRTVSSFCGHGEVCISINRMKDKKEHDRQGHQVCIILIGKIYRKNINTLQLWDRMFWRE